MKIGMASDLHGVLPDIEPVDILFLGGDICPGGWNAPAKYQLSWLVNECEQWLNRIPAKHVVGTWGNHCWLPFHNPHMVPTWFRWKVIVEGVVEVEGLRVFCSAFQLPYNSWAFNLPEEMLERKYRQMPDDTDVVVSHGPPYGFGDRLLDGTHVGSVSLLKRIQEVKPKYVVTGHVHEARGIYEHNGTKIINAALWDHHTGKRFSPFYFEM